MSKSEKEGGWNRNHVGEGGWAQAPMFESEKKKREKRTCRMVEEEEGTAISNFKSEVKRESRMKELRQREREKERKLRSFKTLENLLHLLICSSSCSISIGIRVLHS
ncbi:hypothetical protein CKAN_01722800 [Cinnamomum micranthum f. kanehirae]|uniref:Uncharacterized protein n=1 Tax=Cinnamomum micranthum f. kanehirae TaxID=337451 RepID=A0A3S3N4R6_9MAGN|nr:hypothetical protein CKAN_01722800 [Cinnamomum micranthum f. kanehirae]